MTAKAIAAGIKAVDPVRGAIENPGWKPGFSVALFIGTQLSQPSRCDQYSAPRGCSRIGVGFVQSQARSEAAGIGLSALLAPPPSWIAADLTSHKVSIGVGI